MNATVCPRDTNHDGNCGMPACPVCAPLTPATETPLEQARREYDAAHKAWMNTSRFVDSYKYVMARLVAARQKYIEETSKANPNWIVM